MLGIILPHVENYVMYDLLAFVLSFPLIFGKSDHLGVSFLSKTGSNNCAGLFAVAWIDVAL